MLSGLPYAAVVDAVPATGAARLQPAFLLYQPGGFHPILGRPFRHRGRQPCRTVPSDSARRVAISTRLAPNNTAASTLGARSMIQNRSSGFWFSVMMKHPVDGAHQAFRHR